MLTQLDKMSTGRCHVNSTRHNVNWRCQVNSTSQDVNWKCHVNLPNLDIVLNFTTKSHQMCTTLLPKKTFQCRVFHSLLSQIIYVKYPKCSLILYEFVKRHRILLLLDLTNVNDVSLPNKIKQINGFFLGIMKPPIATF